MIWAFKDGRSLDLAKAVRIVGILNVTPDSFYDGGRYVACEAAVARGLEIEKEGADVVDIGGESSRPPLYGPARRVSAAEECDRVLPVIEALRRRSGVAISVDTTKAEVARLALEAGADIVNDITALGGDPEMAGVVAAAGAPVVLMHMRGTPATMQQDTRYGDVVEEVGGFLRRRATAAQAAGIEPGRIALDPGLGFGKSVQGNMALLRRVDALVAAGYPVLVGASRKSFIWKPAGLSPEDSLEGSLAAAVLAVAGGARLLRVHDVTSTCRAVRLAEAVLDRAVESCPPHQRD